MIHASFQAFHDILVTKPISITPVLSLARKASEKILPVKTITQGKSKPLVENIFRINHYTGVRVNWQCQSCSHSAWMPQKFLKLGDMQFTAFFTGVAVSHILFHRFWSSSGVPVLFCHQQAQHDLHILQSLSISSQCLSPDSIISWQLLRIWRTISAEQEMWPMRMHTRRAWGRGMYMWAAKVKDCALCIGIFLAWAKDWMRSIKNLSTRKFLPWDDDGFWSQYCVHSLLRIFINFKYFSWRIVEYATRFGVNKAIRTLNETLLKGRKIRVINVSLYFYIQEYSQLSLKQTPSGPKLLSALERCPL